MNKYSQKNAIKRLENGVFAKQINRKSDTGLTKVKNCEQKRQMNKYSKNSEYL